MGSKGYIFLEPQHPIVEDLVKTKLAAYAEPNAKGDKALEPMNVKIADFDGVYYQVVVKSDRPTIMQINLYMSVLKDIKAAGGANAIKSLYGKYETNSVGGSDLTMEIDASSTSNVEEVAALMGLLKRNIMAAPLQAAFDALVAGNGSSVKPCVLQTRPQEQMIIQPASDRINVAFSIEFTDPTDAAVADIFLQEFVAARRNQSNAPNVKYQRDVPSELKNINGVKSFKTTVGFLMFTVTKAHVTGAQLEKVATLILGLRSYLHYHIKASKAHLHTRMRAKVKDFLLVLNRAKPDTPEKAKKAYRTINF